MRIRGGGDDHTLEGILPAHILSVMTRDLTSLPGNPLHHGQCWGARTQAVAPVLAGGVLSCLSVRLWAPVLGLRSGEAVWGGGGEGHWLTQSSLRVPVREAFTASPGRLYRDP